MGLVRAPREKKCAAGAGLGTGCRHCECRAVVAAAFRGSSSGGLPMLRGRVWASVSGLVGMQVLGQTVLWEYLWGGAFSDVRDAAAIWWAWTAVQVVMAIPVAIGLVRAGFAWVRCGGVMAVHPRVKHPMGRTVEDGGHRKSGVFAANA